MLEQNYVAATRCLLKYKLPLAHLVDDFFGKLKGRTRGYASLDYEDAGYEAADIVKMEVLSPSNLSTDWLDAGQRGPLGCTRECYASKPR
jgi:translation elongation factor EF-4